MEAVRVEREQEILSLKGEIQNLKALNSSHRNEKEKVNLIQDNTSKSENNDNLLEVISKQEKEIEQLGAKVKAFKL